MPAGHGQFDFERMWGIFFSFEKFLNYILILTFFLVANETPKLYKTFLMTIQIFMKMLENKRLKK